VWLWQVFSWVRTLPSTTSAEACASLFGGFTGTTARSDSSPAYTSGVRLWAFPDRFPRGNTEEVSRFSCRKCLGVPGVYDYAGLCRDSRLRPRIMLPSASLRASAS
jgi:hypothetical protein